MRLRHSFHLLFLGAASLVEAAPVTGWVAIIGNAGFSGGSEATSSPSVTGLPGGDTIAAAIPSTTLSDGESIALGGSVTFNGSVGGNQFRIGLFNSPAPPAAGSGSGYIGINADAPSSGTGAVKFGDGTATNPFSGTASTNIGSLSNPGGTAPAGSAIDFSLTITRDGGDLDVEASLSNTAGGGSWACSATIQDWTPPAGFNYRFNSVAFLMGNSIGSTTATFSNITVTGGEPPADTDGDGLPDSFEQTIIDADGGDLVDGFEDVMGTGASPAVTDFDGDSANDGEEFAEGTDPLDEDSDDDGFHDGAETNDGTFDSYDYGTNTGDTGTDPLDDDTDGDGLLDGVESDTGSFVDADNTGTDPLDSDSDDDGTPDGVEVTDGTDPNNAASNLTDHILGIEFNRSDAFGSPSQSLFRVVSGSTTQGGNSSSYSKTIGSYQVTVSQPNATALEFRGANTDSSRAIPGGDTSLSFLVADFIATREGAIDIDITGLPAGDYAFRSYHLDTITGTVLGFAQGATTTTPNIIEARIGGVLQASVQPTALGTAGLGTTFINDGQIPTLGFAFNHDGSSPLTIELRSTESNGADNHLLLNGFELFLSNP